MYSQGNEDEIVLGLFPDGHIGRVLEIGAWDPIDKSNSRLLIQKGWQAVLIECAPRAVKRLLKCYGDGNWKDEEGPYVGEANHHVHIVSACVSFGTGLTPMRISDDAVSTTDRENYEKWKGVGHYLGTLWVPMITLEGIANQFGGFDFVSIDAEGTSVDLALRYLALGYRAKVICVEHDHRFIELSNAFQAAGYRMVHENENNRIYSL